MHLTLDNLAEEMDSVMARLQRAGMAHCAPKLNPKQGPAKWPSDKGASWKLLANEKPKSEMNVYETHFECVEKRQNPLGNAW
jgi:glycerol transport system substrate-binding protein